VTLTLGQPVVFAADAVVESVARLTGDRTGSPGVYGRTVGPLTLDTNLGCVQGYGRSRRHVPAAPLAGRPAVAVSLEEG
jgi:hypothetical protein